MVYFIDTHSFDKNSCKKLLLLDRDGVINIDESGYFHNKNNVIFIEKNINLIKKYSSDGWFLCVVTNQSGIGRGYFSLNTFKDLCISMTKSLKLENIIINRWYFCPHNPEKEKCNCRKPSPGMLYHAINFFNPEEVLFIGDKDSDKKAAENAKIKFIKV